MDKVYTVGELKEFLKQLPDDAYVYEQITFDGKELRAISSHWDYSDVNTRTCKAWDFPDFVMLPLTSQDTMEQLTEIYYKNKEE